MRRPSTVHLLRLDLGDPNVFRPLDPVFCHEVIDRLGPTQ